MIDAKEFDERIDFSLARIHEDPEAANRIIIVISNRLADNPEFVKMAQATYNGFMSHGMNPTSCALALCMGMLLATGKVAWTPPAKTDFPEIPPGQLVS